MWPTGRLNRSEPSSDDEWRHSLKMMVNYEDDYKKKIISKQNHVVVFSSDCDFNHSLAYTVRWHKYILTFNFENNATQWSMTGGISIMYRSKAY